MDLENRRPEHLDDLEVAPRGVLGGAQDRQVLACDFEVGVVPVGLHVTHHDAGLDARGELGLDIRLGPPGIATVVELHGLGDDHRALPVDGDAAALVHHP